MLAVFLLEQEGSASIGIMDPGQLCLEIVSSDQAAQPLRTDFVHLAVLLLSDIYANHWDQASGLEASLRINSGG